MAPGTGGFALILIAALVLSVMLSLLQHRTYARAAQRMTRAFAGEQDFYLVSGRGKGRLRGAVVLLVIDSASRRVVAAEAMAGVSVLARFRGHPEIIGPLGGVTERTTDKKLRQAVQQALDNYADILRARTQRARTA